MFLTLLLISVVLVALAIIGLGVSIFFKKNGKFPETRVGNNPEMRKLGLSCAKSEELKKHNLQQNINATKGIKPNISDGYSGCAGCNCSTPSAH